MRMLAINVLLVYILFNFCFVYLNSHIFILQALEMLSEIKDKTLAGLDLTTPTLTACLNIHIYIYV